MLPREFDPNTFEDARRDQMTAVDKVIDLTKAPGGLTIKKDDFPRWTAWNTFQLVCLVGAIGLVVWGFVR